MSVVSTLQTHRVDTTDKMSEGSVPGKRGQMQTRFLLAFASAFAFALICTRPCHAGETGGRSSNDTFRKSLNDLNDDSSIEYKNDSPTKIKVDGKVYDGKTIAHFPEADNALSSACQGASTDGPCGNKEKFSKVYDAAARALGLPSVVLVCLTKQETGFKQPDQPNSAKAWGLTQFIPETAENYETLIKKSKYTRAWGYFKEFEGTSKDVSAFSKNTLRSANREDQDVQIFGAAMHLRETMAAMEKEISEKFDLNSKDGMMKLIDFLLAGYNGGPGRAKQCLQASGFNTSSLPKETQDYIKNINACIEKASGGR